MSQYLESIEPALITLGALRKSNGATDTEIHDFRRLAGKLVLLGSGALPQAAFFGCHFQQRVPNLKMKHVLDANRDLKQLKKFNASITFKKPP